MPSGVSTDWSRVVNTTLRKYQKEAEPTLVRNLPLTAVLGSSGRIETNVSGDGYDWAMEYQRAQVQGNSGNTSLTFDAVDRYIRAFMEYRGYVATDSLKKRDFLKNRSPEALIKYYDKMGPKLFEDMERQFAVEQYIDGNASGNSERIHGLESMFGVGSGQTVDVTTGVIGAYDAADYVFAPDDTYAEIDTDLGAYGGAWNSGSWPDSGEGSDTYDFASPIIVNYESTAFGGSSATWRYNGYEAIRFGVTATQKDQSAKGIADMGMLDRRLYRLLKTDLSSREKIEVTASNTKLRSLGFRDSIEIDGCSIMGVFGVPAGVGYLLNTNHVRLVSMQKKLFEIEGPVWDMQTRCYRTVVDFLGNLIFDSPKYFCKLRAAT
jgi:hypothetical protein